MTFIGRLRVHGAIYHIFSKSNIFFKFITLVFKKGIHVLFHFTHFSCRFIHLQNTCITCQCFHYFSLRIDQRIPHHTEQISLEEKLQIHMCTIRGFFLLGGGGVEWHVKLSKIQVLSSDAVIARVALEPQTLS